MARPCLRSPRAGQGRYFATYGLPAKYMTRRQPADRLEPFCAWKIRLEHWLDLHAGAAPRLRHP